MHTWVIGDIHGASRALEQCLERSNFNFESDRLICLGDICDGWPETRQAFNQLLKIKNLIVTLGNHDFWAFKWARYGEASDIWLSQGGQNTVDSYPGGNMDRSHLDILEKAKPYHLEANKLFVHAGINPDLPLSEQDEQTFYWDRTYFNTVIRNYEDNIRERIAPYEEVYIGHSPIHRLNIFKPFNWVEAWLMDTGAGWEGVLSIMDVDTKEYYISDRVDTLYPPGSGRIKV